MGATRDVRRGNVVVNFRIHCSELLDGPEHRLAQTVAGDIGLFDGRLPNEMLPVGSVQADLFHLQALECENVNIFAVYDDQSQHLADAFHIIFDEELGGLRPRALKLTNFPFEEAVCWRVNITRLDILPEHRGHRYGLRAMLLLRQFVGRDGLIVTAKAFPEEEGKSRFPTKAEILKLKAYYLTEPKLGFKSIGRASDGWLVANWTSP